MSEDSRWDVNDFAISEWDEGDDVLGELRYWASDKQGEDEPIRDIEFIVELVHEIERQQTENIRLEDETKAWRYKHGYVTTELPLISPPQPFYMEAES